MTMNIKKTLFTALLACGCFVASAQEEVKTEYTFQPHWYIQGQIGAQYTLGEIDFGKLLSPTAQLGLGYEFNKNWGTRLTVNAWQSKGGSEIFGNTYKWKYNYIAPVVDVTFNLSNAIAGYNPNRKVDVSLFAGIGANFAFNNDEANDVRVAMKAAADKQYPLVDPKGHDKAKYLTEYWEDKMVTAVGNFGAYADYKLNDRWSLGLEFAANFVNDHYNSKHAPNADWYFNTMLGVKYNLSAPHTSRTVRVGCEPQIIEKVVEKIIEKEVPAKVEKREPIRRDIFFTIRSSKVSVAEMSKIQEVAEYMQKYPDSKVDITGYADRGTGNPRVNVGYARNRATMVADILANQYNISRDRMNVDSKGDTVQPYVENVLNRVTICIAE